jgi:hypothetical protein
MDAGDARDGGFIAYVLYIIQKNEKEIQLARIRRVYPLIELS